MVKKFVLSAAAGVLLVSQAGAAATSESFTVYSLSIGCSNTVIWTVNSAPVSLKDQSPYISPSIILHTDGAGKITGGGWFWLDYPNGPDIPYTALFLDVTGKITSSATPNHPTVTLNLKGSGYNLDGTGGAVLNTLKAKFVGQPGVSSWDGSSTIVGTLTGKLTGTTPLGANGTTLNLAMELPGASADPPFETTATPLVLSNKVVQSSKRMQLYSYDFKQYVEPLTVSDHIGKGTINAAKETYKFSIKGLGPQKGWSLSVAGTLGDYTSQVLTNVVFKAPVTAAVKGKVQGQKVLDQASGDNITAEIVTGIMSLDFPPPPPPQTNSVSAL